MLADRMDVTREIRTEAAGGAARGGGERVAAMLAITRGADVGYGEAAPLPGFGRDTVDAAEAALRRWIEDRSIDAVDSPSARWAIEMATGALDARAAGLSLEAWWARPDAPHAITTSAVVDTILEARVAVALGCTALKVKLDGRTDRARLAGLRAAFPSIALRADANQAWPLAEVDDRLRELVSLALEYVEEPAPGLAAQLDGPRPVPLALDESLAEPDAAAWLDRALASGALAAIVCKPTVLGGLARCRALQARARGHGVDAVWSHALEGPVGRHAVLALAHALGGPRAAGVAVRLGEGRR